MGSFIAENDLVKVAMGGYEFTKVGGNGYKLSKLDRFLVSYGVIDTFQDLSCMSLDLSISDHKLVFLSQKSEDYGPRPFKFFNSWMVEVGFDQLVLSSWCNFEDISNDNPSIRLKKV